MFPVQVVPSATTQALAVQQPGGGVSIVHVSIPNQPMHVQSVIQPNQQSVIQAAGGAAALQTVAVVNWTDDGQAGDRIQKLSALHSVLFPACISSIQ
ncbi:hypothetical protein HPB52_018992 [Rhipicephalus sanguineus]|uniref:Uncharacterized protein n=1 Tax=Rhipicephalus sanguineus TaxID=34632 RepID=A0A9D4T1J9_RHISA|nr:hypothetical protein HPB52_018992 [Rhipicephalus sanguineus]